MTANFDPDAELTKMIQHTRNEVRILSESQISEVKRKDVSHMRLEIGVGLIKSKSGGRNRFATQGC